MDKRKRKIAAAAGIAAGIAVIGAACFLILRDKENQGPPEVHVDAGDYRHIPLPESGADVTEEEVAEYAAVLVEQYNLGYRDSGKTTVEDGDEVRVVFNRPGSTEGEDAVILVGSGEYPELEEILMGAAPGTIVESEADEGGGMWRASVGYVQAGELSLDTLTDDGAYTLMGALGLEGEHTADGFLASVRGTLEERADEDWDVRAQDAVKLWLLTNAILDPFPTWTAADYLREHMEAMDAAARMELGVGLEQWLEAKGMDYEEYKAQAESRCNNAAALDAILQGIGEKEGIPFDDEGFFEYLKTDSSGHGYDMTEAFMAGTPKVKFYSGQVLRWLVENNIKED